jgi:hypothetical protein
MKSIIVAVMAGSLIAMAGTAEQTAPMGPGRMGMMMEDCPMFLEGADIVTADTADGIVVTITTKSGNVAELQQKVKQMVARMRNMPDRERRMMGPRATPESTPAPQN